MENFGASMIHLQERLESEGVAQLNFLISPAGWPLCPSRPGATSECGWLGHDLSMMAERLNEVGVPWVDLRNIWGSDKAMVQPLEMRFYREQGRLPIHPDAVGHSRITEGLWPGVESVWSVREKASSGI